VESLCKLNLINKQEHCPHVIQVYDCMEAEENQNIILITELCENTLDQVEVLSPSQQADLCYQLLRGVDFMHRHGMAHRDIKPENIFIKGPFYKLGDFGFAGQKSTFSTILGTLHYMAPEILSGKLYNLKVDVWALGCLFH
jgi:serine/threonine protein kinase